MSMEFPRRILVIGAGASGLTAIKGCKEEALDIICYEKTDNFGGRWRYSEDRSVSVMKSTVCISSKEIGAFSDFPPPRNFPNYLHHTKMLEYLTLYAENFDLLRHIIYQREVIQVLPSADYDSNGKWLVTSSNDSDKSIVTEEFDGIMVCTGRQSEPFLPNYPNQDDFCGTIMHSRDLKKVTSFDNLNVLIVGSGNSAIDAAVEISTVAKQVYLSSRNGFWVFPRLGPHGLPFDMTYLRRNVHFFRNISSNITNCYFENYLETKINHQDYRIKPSQRAMDKHPTVNDDLADKILTGRIIIKGQMSNFRKNGVFFDHEDYVTEIDAVIFATGYAMKLQFLDTQIYKSSNGLPNLYKKVFPINLKHSTMALIGFTDSIGPKIPISESQSRWASKIFAKKIQLCTQRAKKPQEASNCSKTEVHSNELFEDYIQYMDEIAEEYGAKPNICSLFFKDYELFWACFTGPFLPYQYRLVGPNQLKNAREIILDCKQRIKEPFKTKPAGKV